MTTTQNRLLPPMNPLKAFEAAARHKSLTVAADELNVSQVAVSRKSACWKTTWVSPCSVARTEGLN